MAELIIRLVNNPATGKKDIIIDYQSDAGAIPLEHETDHKALVEQLIEGGTLQATELGNIILRRDTPAQQSTPATPQQSSDPEWLSEGDA